MSRKALADAGNLRRLLNGQGNRLAAALHTIAVSSRPVGASGTLSRTEGPALGAHRPLYRAVLVDAAGTFLIPSEPVADVYLRYARPHGCKLEEREILTRFRRAYNTPWEASPLRYVGDARDFWHCIVAKSTGCDRPEVSEAIYEYYSRPEAWHVAPGAVAALQRLRDAGVLTAVVSNFDTRLRPLLRDLAVQGLFDEVVVSAEVHAEKPNPVIFDAAIRALSAAAVTKGTLATASLHQRHTMAAAHHPHHHHPHHHHHQHHHQHGYPHTHTHTHPQPYSSQHSHHSHQYSSFQSHPYHDTHEPQHHQHHHHHHQPYHVLGMSPAARAAASSAGRAGAAWYEHGAGPHHGDGGGGGGGGMRVDFSPLQPEQVVHVGDDRRNDCWGARDAGITAWLWGYDVRSWEQVAQRVLRGSEADDDEDEDDDDDRPDSSGGMSRAAGTA
ncbi:hypothetical protein HYH02_004277 [Chlamydomonas schloesseri]|uniref:Uncharacterized protein n=1 Tax=Chlamydomonas schloesseri TaxID=2026947 RepID=A0A835WPB1_9CHLO|nr:hypothetical protein HYH02_004277 [Chlamydomonas schloesseri]|eukprot:KAG2451007.1 hypothetical protein HYH02_004277 [Chlamydomonas schloesseri]